MFDEPSQRTVLVDYTNRLIPHFGPVRAMRSVTEHMKRPLWGRLVGGHSDSGAEIANKPVLEFGAAVVFGLVAIDQGLTFHHVGVGLGDGWFQVPDVTLGLGHRDRGLVAFLFELVSAAPGERVERGHPDQFVGDAVTIGLDRGEFGDRVVEFRAPAGGFLDRSLQLAVLERDCQPINAGQLPDHLPQ
ncbi:MAG: hypothetical protein ACKV2O_19870, partial [Acidimicrobiales bacterium]